MKRKITTTFLFCLFALATLCQQTAKITSVVDGDTYKILVKGKVITARIVNIDAPELKQQSGIESKAFVNDLINWNEVKIDSLGIDIYKRELVNVYIDNLRVDSIMVRNGWAWVYTAYCKDAMLTKCQASAINEQKGLWKCGVKNVCPPWLFRKYNFYYKQKYCCKCSIIPK